MTASQVKYTKAVLQGKGREPRIQRCRLDATPYCAVTVTVPLDAASAILRAKVPGPLPTQT